MGKIILIFLFVLATTSNASASWAQVKKAGALRIATEGTFRPFNVLEGKTFTGFEVDLANAIAKKLGLKAQWSAHTFDSLLTGLVEHKYDLVAASHAITPERARAVEFIDPHYCSGAMIVTKNGGRVSLKALAGKTIGVSVGTTYADRLKAMGRFKEIKLYRDDTAALENLGSGEIDAWVTDRFVATAMLKTKNDANLDLGEVLFPEMIAMAVAKDDRELKTKISGALSALVKDGTYLSLSQKYFGRDIACRALPQRFRSSSVAE